MNIAEANNLILRPAMEIYVDVQQTAEQPTSVSGANIETDYEAYARVTESVPIVRLMDLTGEGFLNDGGAVPVGVTSGKYGYISEPTKDDGTWTNAPSLTIASGTEFSYLTITVMDSDGTKTDVEFSDIAWSGGRCTLTFDEFTANRRMYILSINLGKTFHFTNDDLISLTCCLRGVNTSLDEGSIELEMSDVEMSAYCGEGADEWIDVFASMDKSSPCRIMMGYADDSVTRTFYVSEQPSYDVTTKVLTVRMADATQKLDTEYGGKYIAGTTANVAQNYYDAIKDILDGAGVEYTESGTVPSGVGTDTSNILLGADSKRNIIAKAVTLFRDENRLAITYRDGGIPELIAGQSPTEWEINEEDVADLTTDIEYIVRDYSSVLSSYKASSSDEEVGRVDGAINGEEYIIDAGEPVYSITSATKGTATLITPYKIKFTCTSNGNAVITGKKIIVDTTSQYKTESSGRGLSVTLDDMQIVESGYSTSFPGITVCEYIQGNGTPYIDTGYKPNANTVLEFDFQIVATSTSTAHIFGCNDGTNFYNFWQASGTNHYYYHRIGTQSNTSTSKKSNTSRTTVTIDNPAKKITLTGGTTYSATFGTVGNIAKNLYLFRSNSDTLLAGISLKVYGCRIYENGQLLHNFVPAYDSNNIGLYDTVTETLFTNAGSGTFTKGADVPSVEIVSLVKNGMTALLSESNLKYSWTWRGNPHWQTLDHITMHRLDGTDLKLTLLEQDFTFEQGGLSCDCTARGGWF